MSTRLTQNGIPMVDSQSLKLVQAAAQLQESTNQYLCKSLKRLGYESINPSALSFLSTLECGVNYGSEIARNLGVSRQMVAKTVKGLCHLGYLEQREAKGKQKEIVFTVRGESLISTARQLLADVDSILVEELGNDSIDATFANFDWIKRIMVDLNEG